MNKKSQDNKSRRKPLIELIPQDKGSQQVLAERAKRFSQPLSNTIEDKQQIHYVRFKLGKNECYGIPYSYIKEIILYAAPTKVPFTAQSIAGIINRHGTLIPVLNLNRYFNLVSAHDETGSHFIVVSSKGISLAILVDAIDGSDSFNEAILKPPFQFEGVIKPEYIQGLHKSTIAIVNVGTLVSNLLMNPMHVKESMS